MAWVKAIDLDAWADSLVARGNLPKLVRRLIQATTTKLTRADFPADEEIQRHGFDGIVECLEGNAFVPSGISGWEMGVNTDPRSKASADFNSRSSGDKVEHASTTFVFVTPRDWSGKTDWVTERIDQKIWSNVRVLDSSNLAEWLELAPSVDAWLAREIGKRPEGVMDIDYYWDGVTSSASPPLNQQVFTTSRNNAKRKLIDWALGPASALAVDATAPKDVIDFVAAVLTSPEQFESQLLAQSVIVEANEAWQSLVLSKYPLLLIQDPSLELSGDQVAVAVKHGHHVLLCSHRFAPSQAYRLQLPRVFRDELLSSLRAIGVDDERASRLARESGGSMSVLKRLMATVPSNSLPAWCAPDCARNIAPLLLVGAWDDSMTADQEIVSLIAGKSYTNVLEFAQGTFGAAESPIVRTSTRWSLLSREDSWLLGASYVTTVQLNAFEKAAIEVLGQDDPKFSLPPDERWMAAVRNKSPKHSAELREAMANTIALLGARSEAFQASDRQRAMNVAIRIVRRLLPEDSTWMRWATMSRYLPELAEAAPEEVLDAMERDLRSADPQLPLIFADSGPAGLSECLHAGVLWALETLAWNQSLLPRVSIVLAQLAKLDPGGNWANRPLASLQSLFRTWYPQSGGDTSLRLRVLDLLIRRSPDVAWTLLLSLMPSSHDTATHTHRPAYREWIVNAPGRLTDREYREQVEGISRRLIANCSNNASRLISLCENANMLPTASVGEFVAAISGSHAALTSQEQYEIWSALQEVTSRNRRHNTASWALSAEHLAQLEHVCKEYAPQSPVKRAIPLFERWPECLREWEGDFSARDARLHQLRGNALSAILERDGIEGAIELARQCESPWIVGYLLAANAPNFDATILPAMLRDPNEACSQFAFGYATHRFNTGQWEWVDTLNTEEWGALDVGHLARVFTFNNVTWDWIELRGEEAKKTYWTHVVFYDTLEGDSLLRAVNEFSGVDRPWASVGVLNRALHKGHKVPWQVISKTLLVALNSKADDNTEANGRRWELRELIGYLQNDGTADVQEVAGLEWAMLPLLDKHTGGAPKTLHRLLRQQPGMFAELMCMMFYPRHSEEESRQPPTEQQKLLGRRAYELLHEWDEIPGAEEDGSVNELVLRQWLSDARLACAAVDRAEIGDDFLGQLLAYAPPDPTGVWPCIAVRNIVEDMGGDDLISGLRCGILNKRGVTSRSPKEGGDQERALAKQFRDDAAAIEVEWPKVGALLRSIANSYEAEARMHDDDVHDW